MIKISYKRENSERTGTSYNQTVRATMWDAVKIIEVLAREAEKAQEIKRTKRTFSNEEMHKIAYQKHPVEAEQEIIKGGKIKYFLNLTQLATLFEVIQNKRLLWRNTILIIGE